MFFIAKSLTTGCIKKYSGIKHKPPLLLTGVYLLRLIKRAND